MLNVAICDDEEKFTEKILLKIKDIFTNLKAYACIYLFTGKGMIYVETYYLI